MYQHLISFFSTNLITVILCLVLLVAVITDIQSQRIPNVLTFPSALLAIGIHSVHTGFHGFLFSFYGMLAGTFLLLIPYIMGGMGAGDAKLMGAVGAFVGAKAVMGVFLLTALCGGIYAVGLVLVKRRIFKGFFRDLFETVKSVFLTKNYKVDIPSGKGRPRLCYGVAIAMGAYLYIGLDLSGLGFWEWVLSIHHV